MSKDSKRMISVTNGHKDAIEKITSGSAEEVIPLTEVESANYLFDDDEKVKRY